MTLTQEDLRSIGQWAADCAERVLPIFETKFPSDPRPREAIAGIREFARGGKRTVRLRSLALAALAAGREVDDPAASAAARAAGLAAASAYTKALPNPHHAKHILAPAACAAQARELAGNVSAAGDNEIQRAIEHASAAVRTVAQKWPARDAGRGRLDALMHQLDAGLRD